MNCKKCKDLRATLGWSGRVQVTENGSGQILCSPYIDRLLNDEFYPTENKPEDNLDAWPTCPDCGQRLKPSTPTLDALNEAADVAAWDLKAVCAALLFVFLGLMLLLLLS